MSNITEGIFTTKIEHNALWLLLLHHNSIEGGFFKNKEEAKFSLNKSRYSIISKLNEISKIDGKYEFLLEYPISNYGKYNRWTQSNDPLLETCPRGTTQNVTGFEYSHLDFNSADCRFGGLRTHPDSTLLSGQSYCNSWNFAIGATSKEFSPSIPGNCKSIKEVNLWVRILTYPRSLFCPLSLRKSNNIEISIIMFIIYVSDFSSI